MKISGVQIHAFGGVRDLTLSFPPGISVVLGDNESGKSTIFRAIQHGLLTPTDLDKRKLKRELDPFFPRPDGNFAEVEITITDDNVPFVIRKRWGADSEEVATAGGVTVRGSEKVSRVINRFMPVSAATFRTILLADQAQLDQTTRLLGEDPTIRDEAAGVLRRVRLGSGGVSPEAFLRLLGERRDALCGRWDLAADKPEGGRGLSNPWVKGAGEVVRKFYEVMRLRERHEGLLRAENELEGAGRRMDEAVSTFRDLDTVVSEHEETAARLRSLGGLDSEISGLEERLSILREANRRWPVLKAEIESLAAELAESREKQAKCEHEVRAARENERLSSRHERLGRVESIQSQIREAQAVVESCEPVDSTAVAELRKIEQALPYAQARLKTGSLTAKILLKKQSALSVVVDGGENQSLDPGENEETEIAAARHIVMESDSIRVEVESGEESFESLLSQRDTLESQRNSLVDQIGYESSDQAESAENRRQRAESDLGRLQAALQKELEVASPELVDAAQAELQAELNGFVADTEPVDVAGLTRELSAAGERTGELDARLKAALEEGATLATTYQDQDSLENSLGETRARINELVTRRDGADLPSGHDSVEEFLSYYDTRVREREAAREDADTTRVEYARLVGAQDEVTSAEVRTELDECSLELDRLKTEARVLERVTEHAQAVLHHMDDTVYDPFVNLVRDYAMRLTADAYRPATADDPFQPTRFAQDRSGAAALPFDLLSQGTRDSLALAVRLALATTALDGRSAPFVLDDPLVDMDPDRRKLAVQALVEFSQSHQVIVMTCHPEHAALFPRDAVVSLPN